MYYKIYIYFLYKIIITEIDLPYVFNTGFSLFNSYTRIADHSLYYAKHIRNSTRNNLSHSMFPEVPSRWFADYVIINRKNEQSKKHCKHDYCTTTRKKKKKKRHLFDSLARQQDTTYLYKPKLTDFSGYMMHVVHFRIEIIRQVV